MIIADIVTALRHHGYKVDTVFVNREATDHVSVVLGGFEPKLDTCTTYLPEIEVHIVFYKTDGDEAVTQIKDIIKIVHEDVVLVNYHHFRFESVNINPTNNDIEITMIIKYRELINLG